jgi:N-methylhydantoinase A
VARARLPDDVAIRDTVRRAYFGPDHGWLEASVLGRSQLATPRRGPCIVEEYDSTCVVRPGSLAGLDKFGNIVVDLPAARTAN